MRYSDLNNNPEKLLNLADYLYNKSNTFNYNQDSGNILYPVLKKFPDYLSDAQINYPEYADDFLEYKKGIYLLKQDPMKINPIKHSYAVANPNQLFHKYNNEEMLDALANDFGMSWNPMLDDLESQEDAEIFEEALQGLGFDKQKILPISVSNSDIEDVTAFKENPNLRLIEAGELENQPNHILKRLYNMLLEKSNNNSLEIPEITFGTLE